jgi:hypothetical protein
MGVEKVLIEQGNGVDKPNAGESLCSWFKFGIEANTIRQSYRDAIYWLVT